MCPGPGEGERASTPLLLPGRNVAGIFGAGLGSEGNPRGGRSGGEVAGPLLNVSAVYGRRDLDVGRDEEEERTSKK